MIAAPPPEETPETWAGGRMSDLAYDRVLEALFDRRVQAGAFVSQNDLVKLLGIPLAPLRDALRVLQAEGVLVIHPRSGIQFVKPGLELTRATYQFRAIIERAAVRVFAETADESELERIERRHEKAIESIEQLGLSDKSLAEMEALEGVLHNAVTGSLRNPLIETTYRRMNNYLRLVRLDRRLTAPIALRSMREHMAIISACKERDADKAEAAVTAHFAAALQRHLGMY